jgi:hypothetical protein
MIKQVFLDVDGTIADFTGYALKIFDRPDLILNQTPGVYGIHELLGISKEQFWNQIDNAFFWSHIPAYEGAYAFVRKLYAYCKSEGIKLHYCTVGNVSPFFPSARAAWLREFNTEARVAIPMILMDTWEDKALLAKYNTLFIDDNDRVIESVRDGGGQAVMVPQLWNRDWKNASNPPKYDAILEEAKHVVEGQRVYAFMESEDMPGAGVCDHLVAGVAGDRRIESRHDELCLPN